MQEPLEQLLADLKRAIEASEAGTDNQEDIARLAGEVERRLTTRTTTAWSTTSGTRSPSSRCPTRAWRPPIGRAADALSALGL